MSFPRYPKYQTSGVEWLDDVPEHWAVKPLKVVASFNDDVLPESFDAEEEIEYVDIGSVSLAGGIERTETFLFGNAPSRARRKVQDGDVIASTVRTYLKAIAPVIAPSPNMIVSTGFAVIRPGVGLISHFAKFALQTNYFVDSVISRSTGVSYPAINASEMAGIVITVPPLAEQTAIAAFLDRETGKIDELVAEQRRLMELLKEKRQAVISHAVTQGLNPQAPMKPSGIEWLGNVPEHWEVSAIKRFSATITDGAHISPETDGGVYPFVSTKDISGDSIDFENCLKTSPSTFDYMVKTGCRPLMGDVLFSKDGTIGRTVIVKEDRDFVVASSLIIIRPKQKELDPFFLNQLCQSRLISNQVDSAVKGAGLPRLSIQNLLKVCGCFPPLAEQTQIADFLDRETAKIDELVMEQQRAIDLLQERRTALISAAVTGQIDVRLVTPE